LKEYTGPRRITKPNQYSNISDLFASITTNRRGDGTKDTE